MRAAMQLYKSAELLPLGPAFSQGRVFTLAKSIAWSPEMDHKTLLLRERKQPPCSCQHVISEKLLMQPSSSSPSRNTELNRSLSAVFERWRCAVPVFGDLQNLKAPNPALVSPQPTCCSGERWYSCPFHHVLALLMSFGCSAVFNV